MKPKEYVKRFNLKESTKFDRKEFIDCLIDDFRVSLNLKTLYVSWFSQCVHELKFKYDSIFNDTKMEESNKEKLWKFIYATEIIPIRGFYFPNWEKSLHEFKMATDYKYRNKVTWEKYEEERDKWIFSEWSKYFSEFMNKIKNSFLGSNHYYEAVNQAKEVLGIKIDTNWSAEDVNERYRKMSKLTHPDVGGNPEVFIKLKTARDFLLEVCNNE